MTSDAKLNVLLTLQDRASPGLKTFGGTVEALSSKMVAAGAGLAAVGGAIVGIGVLGVKASIDFESAMTGVAKTVDASVDDLEKLGREFRNLSKEIPITAVELANIGETAGQLGIAAEDILGFTRVMADLSVTTNLTAQEAATSMARIANITKLPQDAFDRLGSSLVALGNNSATTEAEILDFGLRIAGAGEIAGLAQSDILAIGAAMSSVGVQAEAGGTAVQKVLIAMTEAVATANQDLDEFARVSGLTAQEFARVWETDAAGAFAGFVEGLGRAGTDAFQILETLGLQDQRLIRGLLSVANAGDLLTKSIALSSKAFEENTALTEEARKRYESAAAKVEIFKNQINNLMISIGTALVPALQDMLSAITPIIDGLATLIEQNPTLTKVVLASGVAVALLGTALLTVGVVAPAAAAGLVLVKTALIAVGGAGLIANAGLGPLALALGAIGIVAAVVFTKMNRVSDTAMPKMRRATKDLNAEVGTLTKTLEESLIPAFDPKLTDAVDTAQESLTGFMKSFGALTQDVPNLTQRLSELNDMLMGIITPDEFFEQRDIVKEATTALEEYHRLLGTKPFVSFPPSEKEIAAVREWQEAVSKAFDALRGIKPIVAIAIDLKPLTIMERAFRAFSESFGKADAAIAQGIGAVQTRFIDMTAAIVDQNKVIGGSFDAWTRLGIPLIDTKNLFFDLTTEVGRADLAMRDLAEDAAQRMGEMSASISSVEQGLINAFGELDAFVLAFQAGTLSEAAALDILITKNETLNQAISKRLATEMEIVKVMATADPLRNVPAGFFESGSIAAARAGAIPAISTGGALTPEVVAAILANIRAFGAESVRASLDPGLLSQFIRQEGSQLDVRNGNGQAIIIQSQLVVDGKVLAEAVGEHTIRIS